MGFIRNHGRHVALRFARKQAKKLNLKTTDARPDELILMKELDPTTNQFLIDVADSSQKQIASGVTKGLVDRDAFLAHSMSFGILSAPIVGGKPIIEAGNVAYFGDKSIFDEAAGASGLSEAQQIDAFYMGNMTITTNTKNRLEEHPLIGFRRVFQTQGSANTTNMQDGSEMVDLGSLLRFGGGDRNFITINTSSPIRDLVAGNANHKNYLFLRFDGTIIKGATNKAFLGDK